MFSFNYKLFVSFTHTFSNGIFLERLNCYFPCSWEIFFSCSFISVDVYTLDKINNCRYSVSSDYIKVRMTINMED